MRICFVVHRDTNKVTCATLKEVPEKIFWEQVGELVFTPEEFELFEATILNGQGMWLEGEAKFEFMEASRQHAFTEGK